MPNALSRRLTLLALPLALAACASWPGSGWVTLIDGERGLDNWNRVGDANWQIDRGGITANQGKGGFLVSKQSYKDFEIYAEFWASAEGTERLEALRQRILAPRQVLAAHVGLQGRKAAHTAGSEAGKTPDGLVWRTVDEPTGDLTLYVSTFDLTCEGKRLRVEAEGWSDEIILRRVAPDQVGGEVVMPAEARRDIPMETEIVYEWVK